jgi:hypothetical protein
MRSVPPSLKYLGVFVLSDALTLSTTGYRSQRPRLASGFQQRPTGVIDLLENSLARPLRNAGARTFG